MKKIACLIMSVFLLLAALPFSVGAAGEEYKIALAEDATAADRGAAETLRRYLAEILPVEPVMTDSTENADFIIGGTPENAADIAAGGYTVARQDGGAVYIRGVGGSGALNGVYAFLRDHCGCRWYAPEEIVIP